MFILCKRNILFRTPDGAQTHLVRRDFIGNVPDWIGQTRYFRQLVADGVIAVPETTKDADVQDAAEAEVKDIRPEPETGGTETPEPETGGTETPEPEPEKTSKKK